MALMKYSTKITLFSSYFDLNDRLTAKGVLSIFQDVASIHAEEIGVGYLTMLQKNLYWVLSRVKFDILKMPTPYSNVIVETWPQEKGKIDFDRDMRILSEDGEVLVIASSKWCVIDTIARRLQRTDGVNYLGEVIPDKNYEDKFAKIMLPDIQPVQKFTHIVRFSDLDHNKHMNNTNYANLVLSAIENKVYTHFEINFVNECVLNDQICVMHIKDNNKEYVKGVCEGQTAFLAYTC
ncbi:MAG: hypothetical protein E7376_04945 [Clostridiales bacterium]|nr:hypothetical protein [Clostridiales bacterium]